MIIYILVYSSASFFNLPLIKPTHQVVYNNTKAEILCYTFDIPKWKTPRGSITSKFNKGAMLIFKKLSKKQSGTYTCEGYDINNIKFTAHSELLVASKLQYSGCLLSKNKVRSVHANWDDANANKNKHTAGNWLSKLK